MTGDETAPVDFQQPARPLMGAYTGRLKAARVPPAGAEQFWRKRAKKRPSLKGFVLEQVPEATEYSDDDALMDPVEVVRLVKSFPEIDAQLKEAFSLDPDDGLAPEPKRGRPRHEGRFDLLYLAFGASRDPAMESFWHRYRSSLVWEVCEFTNGRPDYDTMRNYFIAYEKLERRGYREAAHRLIRNGKKHDRLLGLFLIIDATRFDSVAVHEHCCPDPVKCRKRWEEEKKQLGKAGKGRKGPAQFLVRATDDTYNEAKSEEVAAAELAEGELPPTVAPPVGVHGRYLYREVNGHLYRTLDKSGGLRKYKKAKPESWHGGLLQAFVCPRYRTSIDYQAFASDQMEYDHLPDAWENIEDALGERPLGVSLDGLYATFPCSEFFSRRGTMPIKPHTKRESQTREEMRCDVFDEHQVIRCQHCGSETEHEPYFIFQNGDPRIRVRCLTPHTEACYSWQSVPCAEHWGWVSPLNYKDKVINQVREWHSQMEGFFDSRRARYALAGKDTRSRIRRRQVVPAMQLRAEAALFIDWLRLSLRHGWIGSWKNRNENQPAPIDDKGRLATILRARRRRALQFPYGKQAVKLGLCKPPPEPDDGLPVDVAAAAS